MELQEILNWHLARYPLLQAEDIIKLIYQTVFGPGHLFINSNEKEIEEGLRREFECCDKLSAGRDETEPVDPEGLLVRVNLTPIADSEAKQVLLLQALKETIKTFTPVPYLFLPRVEMAQEWCEKYLPPQGERLKLLKQKLNPPPRHSEIYLQAYRPTYRIVLSRFWNP